jgi:hypothetical protein
VGENGLANEAGDAAKQNTERNQKGGAGSLSSPASGIDGIGRDVLIVACRTGFILLTVVGPRENRRSTVGNGKLGVRAVTVSA